MGTHSSSDAWAGVAVPYPSPTEICRSLCFISEGTKRTRSFFVGRNWIRQGGAGTNCSSYSHSALLTCGSTQCFPAGAGRCQQRPSVASLLLQGTACLGGFALPLPQKERHFSEFSALLTSFFSVSIPKMGVVKRILFLFRFCLFFFTEFLSLVEPLKVKFACQTLPHPPPPYYAWYWEENPLQFM